MEDGRWFDNVRRSGASNCACPETLLSVRLACVDKFYRVYRANQSWHALRKSVCDDICLNLLGQVPRHTMAFLTAYGNSHGMPWELPCNDMKLKCHGNIMDHATWHCYDIAARRAMARLWSLNGKTYYGIPRRSHGRAIAHSNAMVLHGHAIAMSLIAMNDRGECHER